MSLGTVRAFLLRLSDCLCGPPGNGDAQLDERCAEIQCGECQREWGGGRGQEKEGVYGHECPKPKGLR